MIDLFQSNFDFAAVAPSIQQRQNIFVGKNPKAFSDFGIVVVGEKCEGFDDLMGLRSTDILMTAPVEWRMAHLMHRLGAFPSVGQARKNGWDVEIPEGFSQHVVRISKVRGVVTIWKEREL